jgi:phosphoglycolate phosphatase-like HAD superfamily hydrolase
VFEGGWHGGESSIGSGGSIPTMRAVVFDWDGTLVDTMPAIMQANVQLLREHGLPFDEAVYRSAYAPDWRLMYRRLGIPEEAIEDAGARWLELYASAGTLRPFPGVGRSLGRLVEAGFALGIVTAGHRGIVEEQLERFGLAGYLPVRVCGDDDVRAKPHPEPLLRVLEELGVRARPDEAHYVGDAPDDMRMARAVGATGIGIVSILGTREEMLRAGASVVHDSVGEWVERFLAAPERAVTTG